ncbi:(2Fe-2S)-binding protein [Halalkalibacter oceani]|uniref:(2Fe-2S)-binding protein n=1 Tax=Halalkalibacter oceani TaxID=1653776 RepID=UPI00339487A0
MDSKQNITLRINGQEKSWNGDPTRPLVSYIREEAGLTGTKIGCQTGECGACTVMVGGKPTISCILPVAAVAGAEVETIEGVAETETFQHLSEAMMETGGVQCGFCTPGIMMTLSAYIQKPEQFAGNVRAALKNNLCRCTGYQSIFQAVEKVLNREEKSHDLQR